MTAQTTAAPSGAGPAGASVVALTADCVAELADLAGDACLLEGPDARLLAHHVLGAVAPPELIAALVSGSLSGLHAGLSARRKTGVLPSGHVMEGDLRGRRVVYMGLRDGVQPLGGVWLLVKDAHPVALEDLRGPVQRLTRLLSHTAEGADPGCLDGGPLPPGLPTERMWVARLVADASAGELQAALMPAASPLILRPLRRGQSVYVLVAGGRTVTPSDAHAALERMARNATARLAVPVTVGLSSLVEDRDFARAASQADTVALEAEPGSCTSLASVRARLVMRELASSLQSLPDLGPDPLEALVDYDRRRGTELVSTLRTWLDASGDILCAGKQLRVHTNTLRYRLRRINEIISLDLKHDAQARVVLHLQLHAMNTNRLTSGAQTGPAR